MESKGSQSTSSVVPVSTATCQIRAPSRCILTPRSRAYFEMRVISFCGNIEPPSVFSSSISWVGQLLLVQQGIRNDHRESEVQMDVLVQDDKVGNEIGRASC